MPCFPLFVFVANYHRYTDQSTKETSHSEKNLRIFICFQSPSFLVFLLQGLWISSDWTSLLLCLFINKHFINQLTLLQTTHHADSDYGQNQRNDEPHEEDSKPHCWNVLVILSLSSFRLIHHHTTYLWPSMSVSISKVSWIYTSSYSFCSSTTTLLCDVLVQWFSIKISSNSLKCC